MKMKRGFGRITSIFLLPIFVIGLLTIALQANAATDPPSPPLALYGTFTLTDGVGEQTNDISVLANGLELMTFPVTTTGTTPFDYGVVNVAGGSDGDIITFALDGYIISESTTYATGTPKNVDLVAVPAVPELGILKTVNSITPTAGTVVTYTVVVSNSGNGNAMGAIVTDTVPAGLEFVAGSTTLDGSGSTGDAPTLVSGLTVGAGSQVTVTYQMTVTGAANSSITNTVAVSHTGSVAASASVSITVQAAGTSGGVDDDGNVAVEIGTDGTSPSNLQISYDSANNWIVFYDPDNPIVAGSGAVQVDDHTFYIPVDSVTGEVTLMGGDTDDNVQFDLTSGNPFPQGTVINYYGGDQTTAEGDKVEVRYKSGRRIKTVHNDPNDGVIEVSDLNANIDLTINYFELEPLDFVGTAASITVVLSDTADAATWTQVVTVTNRLDGATFEQTNFDAPEENGFVQVELSGGDDTLDIESAALLTNTHIIIDGGDGTDSVTWNATRRIVTQTMTMTVGAETFNFGAASTFPVTLNSLHDKIVLTETTTVNLNSATLALDIADGFDPTGGSFTLIDNQGMGNISGTFNGLIEGASVVVDGVVFSISYGGGSGNDVVLSWVNMEVSTLDDESDGDFSDGDNSLREAIANAADGATITFASGLNGTIDVSGLGTLTILDNVTIDGSGATVTVSGNDSVRVMQVGDGSDSADVTLNNLTIANGSSSGSTGGGGIYLREGNLMVQNSVFENNAYAGDQLGGAISVRTGQVLHVSGSTFSGNSADGGTSDGGGGGAIGIDGTAYITSSTLLNNTAAGTNGAGDAGAGGGAIANAGTLVVTSSTFSGNNADATFLGGGAIDTNGDATINNSTFYNNSAAGNYAGAIGNGVTLVVNNSTFSGNSADFGGAIANFDTATVNNSILANSSASDCYNEATMNGTNNLVESDDNMGLCSLSNSVTDDPVLSSLASNGGDTQTMALGSNSPAIDAGDNCLGIDQRGEARDDLACDIGAYELKIGDNSTVSKVVADGETESFGPTLVRIQRNGGADPGTIVVTKSTQETNEPNGFDIIWTIDADIETGLNLDLTLCYLDSEIPATLIGNEPNFVIFHKPDGGSFGQLLSTPDPTNNCVTANVTSFSQFAVGNAAATAVTLEYFTAAANADRTVTVEWETSQETNHAGFNLYRRAVGSRNAWTQINRSLLASRGTQAQGAVYSFHDTAVAAGDWEYLLEDVENDGSTAVHHDYVVRVAIQVPTAVAVSSTAAHAPTLTAIWFVVGLLGLTLLAARRADRRRHTL